MSSSTPNAPTLRLLGVGGAFTRRYGTTCALLTLAGGAKWLIDCGRQAPDQLDRAGMTWHEIAGQIITHVHGDHVFGLEDFAFSRFFFGEGDCKAVASGGDRPQMIVHSAVETELWECLAPSLRYLPSGSNDGTLGHYFEMLEPAAHESPGENPWRHSETFRAPGLTVVARETPHVPGKPSMALELDVGDGKIAYWSGDSQADNDRLIDLAPRCTVFFHDCTFMPGAGQVHGDYETLARLPADVRAKVVLMHHEDDLEPSNRDRAIADGFRVAMPDEAWNLVTGDRV